MKRDTLHVAHTRNCPTYRAYRVLTKIGKCLCLLRKNTSLEALLSTLPSSVRRLCGGTGECGAETESCPADLERCDLRHRDQRLRLRSADISPAGLRGEEDDDKMFETVDARWPNVGSGESGVRSAAEAEGAAGFIRISPRIGT